MSLEIKFLKKPLAATGAIVIPVRKDKKIKISDDILDKAGQKFLTHVIKTSKNFEGKAGQTLSAPLPEGASYNTAILLGIESDDSDKRPENVQAEDLGGKLLAAIKNLEEKAIALIITTSLFSSEKKLIATASSMAYGALLRSYNFDKYKSKSKTDKQKTSLEKFQIVSDLHTAIKNAVTPLEQTASGVFLARNLVNEAPNTLYPESFVQIIKDDLKPLGVEIDVLDEKKMQKLGMGAILAVGQGSARPPRICIMRWNGAGKKAGGKPLAFVGKGVTFDTGGISIKPAAGMDEMKMDMGGAAAVTGLMKALAARKAKVNVVGIIGLAENMPSANAYRPGDIITSYAGKTIEVLNTDAEGRLVLADCLTYAQETYKPRLVINLATLTGAMMVALGHEYCGTYANRDNMWSELEQASASTGEKLWRMPLDPVWKKDMESTVADLQNLAKSGRMAGACTAAGFLEHFIEENTPWAHMDIAGTAWVKQDRPTVPKFGTGFGVRVLEKFVADNYEDK